MTELIGRIFKATASPAGMPWRWTLAYGLARPTVTRRRARPLCGQSPRAGGGNNSREAATVWSSHLRDEAGLVAT